MEQGSGESAAELRARLLADHAAAARAAFDAGKGDEATAVRFTVLPHGTVANVNTLPKTLVQRL